MSPRTGVALDASGAAYVTGRTTSTDFPTTAGAFLRTNMGGGYDSYVTKVKPNGSGLVYSTFLGGGDDDCHIFGSPYTNCAITVDGAGAAYVTGATESDDFPVTPGATQTEFGRFSDAFVTKIDLGGGGLVCTMSGTEGDDMLTGTSADDVICGLGGNDVLTGRGGADVLDGGAGDDRVTGGSGSDRLEGRAGRDRLDAVDGVGGNDVVNGGPGQDRCSADPGDERSGCR